MPAPWMTQHDRQPYPCLSTDRPPGALYWVGFHIIETDTGLTYRWDGAQYVPAWYSSGRNLLDNGDMEICQREGQLHTNNFALVSGQDSFGLQRGADRWQWVNATSAVNPALYPSYDLTATDPGGTAAVFSTGTGASMGAADYSLFRQIVLASRLIDVRFGRTDAMPMTISFWAWSTMPGTYIVELEMIYSPFRRISLPYTLVANTWTYVVMHIPADTTTPLALMPSDPMGGLNFENYVMSVNFWLASGSDYNSSGTLNSTWTSSGGTGRSVGQVNVYGSPGQQYNVTQIQLEVGNVATPFERIGFAAKKAECLRHYWRHGAQGSDGFAPLAFGMGLSDTVWVGTVQMPVPMIKTPSLTFSGNFRMTDELGAMGVSTMSGFVHASPTMSFVQTTFPSFGATHIPLWLECNNDPTAFIAFGCGG